MSIEHKIPTLIFQDYPKPPKTQEMFNQIKKQIIIRLIWGLEEPSSEAIAAAEKVAETHLRHLKNEDCPAGCLDDFDED